MFSSLRVRLPHRFPLKVGLPKSKFAPCRFEKRDISKESAPFNEVVFSSDATDEENVIFAEEEPHMLPGAYCPVTLGETLSIFNEGPSVVGGNFKIVRKLGWGAYSSVWLAESQGCKKIHTRYQALKLLTVTATSDLLHDKFPEFDSLVSVTTSNPSHPGYHHCTSILGRMIIRHKFPHFCFVFEPMGTNLLLLQRQQPNKVFSLVATKRIVKQVLLALDYTHTECHLVHTDLKLDNILVSLGKDFGDNVDEQIHAHLQENPSETYEPRFDSKISSEPIVTVKSQPLPNFGLNPDLSNLHVKLADFGFALAQTPEELFLGRAIQPDALRAPEIVLGHAWSTPVDIWMLGCLVFECLVRATLFQNDYSPGEDLYAHVHLRRITQLLGPFPKHFLAGCGVRQAYFDENDALRRTQNLPSRTIEACLDNYKRLKSEELGPAADFIRRCLAIDPLARPTAKELLEDEWLKAV